MYIEQYNSNSCQSARGEPSEAMFPLLRSDGSSGEEKSRKCSPSQRPDRSSRELSRAFHPAKQPFSKSNTPDRDFHSRTTLIHRRPDFPQ